MPIFCKITLNARIRRMELIQLELESPVIWATNQVMGDNQLGDTFGQLQVDCMVLVNWTTHNVND